MLQVLVLIALLHEPKTEVEWLALFQRPNEDLPSSPLSPLLQTTDGDQITTPQAWEQQRQRLQTTWLERLGIAPEKPKQLAVQIEGIATLNDHERRLVSFQSEGDDWVRAYLLIPRGLKQRETRPTVVVFHQTTSVTFRESVGLAGNAELAVGLELVRRGYLVLCPECYLMKGAGPATQAQKLAQRRPGWTGLGKLTFDASRCLDFLETAPEVDKARIGCIGHSLGAKQVLYAMAFDSRYRAGVFSEGGIGLAMSNWADPWYLTDQIKKHMPQMDNHQILAMIAPRGFLLLAGDGADSNASWTFVKQARNVYALLGSKHRIGLFNHHRGHALPREASDLAYRWLDYWLDAERR